MITEEELLRIDTAWVMSTENGRRWVWGLLSHCGVYHDIEGDKTAMLKQIGKRQIGLHLLGLISDASEESLFVMMKEAKNKAEEDAYALRKRNTGNSNSTSSGDYTTLDDLLGIGEFDTYASGDSPVV